MKLMLLISAVLFTKIAFSEDSFEESRIHNKSLSIRVEKTQAFQKPIKSKYIELQLAYSADGDFCHYRLVGLTDEVILEEQECDAMVYTDSSDRVEITGSQFSEIIKLSAPEFADQIDYLESTFSFLNPIEIYNSESVKFSDYTAIPSKKENIGFQFEITEF